MDNKSGFSINNYCRRLDIAPPVDITAETLGKLHRAHVYRIPFENFDIHLGRGINLDTGHLFQKMIMQKRGGYCFELNGLFFHFLQELGYRARPLLARVQTRGQPTGRHHQLILVSIDNQDWLADVGFGANGLRSCIPYIPDEVYFQDGQEFRLLQIHPYGTMLQVHEQGDWQNLYSFDMEHVCAADIESGNYFTSTAPSSFFTWLRVATMPNPDGRVSLTEFNLTVVSDGRSDTIQLRPGKDYLETLEERFGIVLDEPYENLRPLNTPPQDI